MENAKLQNHINFKSTTELADELSEHLKQYKAQSMEPDSTQSIPNLDQICMIAEEIAS